MLYYQLGCPSPRFSESRICFHLSGHLLLTRKLPRNGFTTSLRGFAASPIAREILLFAPLYLSRTGWLFGTLRTEFLPASDVTGILRWHKTEAPGDSLYPAGFDVQLNATGGLYSPPAVGKRMLTYSNPINSEADFTLTNGNLESPLSWQATVDFNDVVTLVNNSANVKLKLNRATGKITGNFLHPSGNTSRFSGVVNQKLNRGKGFFLGTDESGAFEFVPR